MLIALILTVVIELIALYLIGERDKLLYLYWLAITALTNILANLYVVLVFNGTSLEYWISVVVIEVLVFLSEFGLCFLYTSDKKKSLKYSAVCNLASYFIGSLILLIFKI